jgi:hypothetical protein
VRTKQATTKRSLSEHESSVPPGWIVPGRQLAVVLEDIIEAAGQRDDLDVIGLASTRLSAQVRQPAGPRRVTLVGMSDDAVSPEQQERNRGLFGSMIGWLLSKNRRPGMIGWAVSFSGKARSGQAQLKRADSGWEFITSDDRDELTTAEVLRLVGTGGFFPRTVDVVPDLAELLFQEAVHQAEESLQNVNAAARHTREAMETELKSDPFPWVFATSELDRAARASIASIVLAIAAGEAQVNRWAEMWGGWEKGEDRLGVAKKSQVLAKRAEHPVSLGEPPYQQLHEATKRRNGFVHSVAIPEPVPVTGVQALTPGSSLSIEARQTCLAVRSSFVDLARRLEVAPPRYLAYCPAAPADDDAAWNSASLMTGARRDPDFPTVSDRLALGDRLEDTSTSC